MKAHGDVTQGGLFKFEQPKWEKRNRTDGPYSHNYDTCSHCGSLSPEALEAVLAIAGVSLELADMKYGHPHKFYAHGVPNGCAGEVRVYGSQSGPEGRKDLSGPAPATQQLKFYTEHLVDLDDVAFARVTAAILDRTGVDFKRQGEGMAWRILRKPTPEAARA